jgi:hypothetical protein
MRCDYGDEMCRVLGVNIIPMKTDRLISMAKERPRAVAVE